VNGRNDGRPRRWPEFLSTLGINIWDIEWQDQPATGTTINDAPGAVRQGAAITPRMGKQAYREHQRGRREMT